MKSLRRPWLKSGEAISERREGSSSPIKQGGKHTFSLPNLLLQLCSDNGLIADWLVRMTHNNTAQNVDEPFFCHQKRPAKCLNSLLMHATF